MSTQNLLDVITDNDALRFRIAWVADSTKAYTFCYELMFMRRDVQIDLSRCAEEYDTISSKNVQWPYSERLTLEWNPVPGQPGGIYLPDGTEIAGVEYVATLTPDGWLVVSPVEYQYGSGVVDIVYYTWGEAKRKVAVVYTPDGKRLVYDIPAGRVLGPAEQWAFYGRSVKGDVILPLQSGLLAGTLGRYIVLGVAAGIAGLIGLIILQWIDLRRIEAKLETIKEIDRTMLKIVEIARNTSDPELRRQILTFGQSLLGEVYHTIDVSETIEQLWRMLVFAAGVAIVIAILKR